MGSKKESFNLPDDKQHPFLEKRIIYVQFKKE
jgi:hypothetical protein